MYSSTETLSQSPAEGHYHSTFPWSWFYPLSCEQAEQHFSLLSVVGRVKQRVRISLESFTPFFSPSFFSHCSLDKRDLTDSVLFVVSSYSPPLIIPSFGHSEAEVCYYLHPLSTLLSNLFLFFPLPSWPMSQMCPIICCGWVGWRKGREEDIMCTAAPHPLGPSLPPPPLSLCSNLIESCWIDWQGNEFGGACIRFQTEWALFTSRHPRRTPAPRSFSHQLSF